MFAAFLAISITTNGQVMGPGPNGKPGTKPPPVKTIPCTLEMSGLPAFAGVTMSMSYDEVLAVYPEIGTDKFFHGTFDADKRGLFTIQRENASNKEVMEDVIQFDLNFRDSAILILHAVYVPEKWSSIKQAVSDFSKLLGVDERSWKPMNSTSAGLECLDFTLYANSQDGNPDRMNTMSIHPKTGDTR
jgi:hypothetical protein